MTMPSITSIHHCAITVSDVEISARWYQNVFGMDRVPVTFPHHLKEDTGYAVLLMDPTSGVAIGLHHNGSNGGETFDEVRTGLDHLSFQVADRAGMDAWVAKLDAAGIEHSGVRDQEQPFIYSTVVFRDPDNIQLELISLG